MFIQRPPWERAMLGEVLQESAVLEPQPVLNARDQVRVRRVLASPVVQQLEVVLERVVCLKSH